MDEKLIQDDTRSYQIKPQYFVNKEGQIRNKNTNRILKPRPDKQGYCRVSLMCTDKKAHDFQIHRIVLKAFNPIENQDEMQVNHKDGNKSNNNLNNLEWVTQSENQKHALENHLRNDIGENNIHNKLKEYEVYEIIDLLLKKKHSQREISEMYGVSKGTIGDIKRKKTWKHLTKDINFD